jgi:hypothetical protein
MEMKWDKEKPPAVEPRAIKRVLISLKKLCKRPVILSRNPLGFSFSNELRLPPRLCCVAKRMQRATIYVEIRGELC